ncbi:MAG: c-type cytochrome domain-containing protein [Saprospiraceae bacterium]
MNHLIGQFHPILVHLPIGILIIAIVFKLWNRKGNNEIIEKIIPSLVGAAWIASIATAFTGYFLSRVGGYENELVNNHKWSGFILAGLIGVLFISIIKRWRPLTQDIAWMLNAVSLLVTGHLGGQLTHGVDYLSFNFKTYHKPVVKNIDSALVYRDLIEPILADKCWSCHSYEKQKGMLRLDGIDHILKGGKHGDIISTQPDQSKMYHRLTLPKSADDHMPPSGQPQPTNEEIKLIGWWLENDITKDKPVFMANTTPEIKSILAEMIEDEKPGMSIALPIMEIAPVDPKLLLSLNQGGIVSVPVSQNSNYLNVILPDSLNALQWASLRNAGKNIAWLSARKIKLNDTAMNTILQFDHLTRIDLSHSTINDTSVQKLTALPMLQVINLNSTKVTEKGLTSLANMKSLQTLYVYNSKVNKQALAQLQHVFHNIVIDTGNYIVPTFPSDTVEYTYEQLAKDKKAKAAADSLK